MCLSIKVNRPESVLAEGVHAGHEWVVTHNGSGYRCGYVKVEPGHPWHGLSMCGNWAEDSDERAGVGLDDLVTAHGGITFAQADEPCDAEGDDAGWWAGFDCCHSGDARDPSLLDDSPDARILLDMDARFPIRGDVIRTQAYVENECRALCEQAAMARQEGGVT